MSKTNFKPSDFVKLGQPCCSCWGKSEIEDIALAYVKALAKSGDSWDKLSREQVNSLLTHEELGYAFMILRNDRYQRWFNIVSNQIADSDGALEVGGFWNLHRLSNSTTNSNPEVTT